MRARARRRGPRSAATGPTVAGLAATLPLLALALLMAAWHTPIDEVARFTGFCLVGVLLPGLVGWRLLGGYRRNLVEDCAAGFAVGCTAQVIVYLASASVQLQRWSWVWGPVVLLVAMLDPEVRGRVWRRVQEPLAPATAWLLSTACALVLLVVHRSGPGVFGPAYTDPAVSSPDLAFHQALSASARYDVPLSALWVAGEPMRYHTFFHQLVAANSWATRIDLTSLVHSLAWLPLALAGSALVFALTQRFLVRGITWAGPLAVVVAGIGGTLQPLPDAGLGGISMAVSAYLNPTQNLATVLFLALALVAIDLLRDQPPRSRWLLLILLALGACGAKATILPLAVCGLGLVGFTRQAIRRPSRTAFVAAAALLAVFVGSVLAIFNGGSSGLRIEFATTFARLSPYSSIRHGDGVDRDAQLLVAAATVAAWGVAAAGVLFLKRLWRDPGTVFLAGCSTAGFAGMLLTTQPGTSQLSFLRTAFPIIAVLSCLGLANLVDRLGDRRGSLLVVAAGIAGLTACGIARVGSVDLPGVKDPWTWTAAALTVAAVLLALGWKLARRSGTVMTVFLTAFVAAGMAGAMLVPLASLGSRRAGELVYAKVSGGGPSRAEAEAARWLKDNSAPGDLVATNAHCITGPGKPTTPTTSCDSRHFWIAALSERQVLVEGWAATNRANRIAVTTGVDPRRVPFWDRRRLAANDAVFSSPSTATVERLRRYGVRWLYADRLAGPLSAKLMQYVRLRHATLDVTIYEFR